MNALELADLLEQKALTADAMEYGFEVDFEEAATMLRQQQAEIEALKAAKIRAYDNGVEDGRKPNTNNKPVAWMHQNPDYAISKHQSLEYNIPLYTHPVKELTLTRDEIRDVWREFPASFTLTPLTIEFARAILRKAQEK